MSSVQCLLCDGWYHPVRGATAHMQTRKHQEAEEDYRKKLKENENLKKRTPPPYPLPLGVSGSAIDEDYRDQTVPTRSLESASDERMQLDGDLQPPDEVDDGQSIPRPTQDDGGHRLGDSESDELDDGGGEAGAPAAAETDYRTTFVQREALLYGIE